MIFRAGGVQVERAAGATSEMNRLREHQGFRMPEQ
jgi:hypothetical protein